jgi:hypothetical protein
VLAFVAFLDDHELDALLDLAVAASSTRRRWGGRVGRSKTATA